MKKEFISLNQKDFKLYLDVRIKLGKISDKIIKTDDLDTALETIEKAKEYGINFPTK